MEMQESFLSIETATKKAATKNCSRFWLLAQVAPNVQQQSTIFQRADSLREFIR